MTAADLLPIFKIAHLVGILIWIGIPCGAYWIALRGIRSPDDPDEQRIERRIREGFVGALWIEHIGLALLIVGAVGMLWATEWIYLTLHWMQVKLALFVLIIVPIEVLDIWWGQTAVGRALERDPGPGIGPELRAVLRRYDRLTVWSIAPLLISWVGFFLMAIFKPHGFFPW